MPRMRYARSSTKREQAARNRPVAFAISVSAKASSFGVTSRRKPFAIAPRVLAMRAFAFAVTPMVRAKSVAAGMEGRFGPLQNEAPLLVLCRDRHSARS